MPSFQNGFNWIQYFMKTCPLAMLAGWMSRTPAGYDGWDDFLQGTKAT
jgi:hypothetical protein